MTWSPPQISQLMTSLHAVMNSFLTVEGTNRAPIFLPLHLTEVSHPGVITH